MMRKTLSFVVAILVLAAVATVVSTQRQQTDTALVRQRYLPEYTKEGDLILPRTGVSGSSWDRRSHPKP